MGKVWMRLDVIRDALVVDRGGFHAVMDVIVHRVLLHIATVDSLIKRLILLLFHDQGVIVLRHDVLIGHLVVQDWVLIESVECASK